MSVQYTEWDESSRKAVSSPAIYKDHDGSLVLGGRPPEMDCHICGNNVSHAWWVGESSFGVCYWCAVKCLPSMIADAFVGYLSHRSPPRPARELMPGKRAFSVVAEMNSTFWRSYAIALEDALGRIRLEAQIEPDGDTEDDPGDPESSPDCPSDSGCGCTNCTSPVDEVAAADALHDALKIMAQTGTRAIARKEDGGTMSVMFLVRGCVSGSRPMEFLNLAVDLANHLPPRELNRMIRIMENWKRAEGKAPR